MDAEARIRRRLAVMMALVYSVQGAFWPLLSIHLVDLGVSERGRGWIFATFALASFVMPLGAGQLVDRLMPTQRFLSLSFAAGSGFLALMAWGATRHVGWLFGLFLAYWLIMAPNYSLSNAIAFRNLRRPARDFGRVRLWGTVGWMASGWLVSAIMAGLGTGLGLRSGRGTAEAFWVAAGLSILTSVYCLTLPDTPPIPSEGRRTSSLRDIVELVRMPGVPVYLMISFCLSLTTPYVYQVMPNSLRAQGMDRAWVATALSLGQWPEIVMLAVLPGMIARWGYRRTLGLGIAAYALRFGSLTFDPPLWLSTAGIPLHGVGVACFSIGGQMFIDGKAPFDRRASAQSLNTVVTGGLGSLLGSLLASEVMSRSHGRFGSVFLVPALITTILLGVLAWRFRPDGYPGKALDRAPKPLAPRNSVASLSDG